MEATTARRMETHALLIRIETRRRHKQSLARVLAQPLSEEHRKMFTEWQTWLLNNPKSRLSSRQARWVYNVDPLPEPCRVSKCGKPALFFFHGHAVCRAHKEHLKAHQHHYETYSGVEQKSASICERLDASDRHVKNHPSGHNSGITQKVRRGHLR